MYTKKGFALLATFLLLFHSLLVGADNTANLQDRQDHAYDQDQDGPDLVHIDRREELTHLHERAEMEKRHYATLLSSMLADETQTTTLGPAYGGTGKYKRDTYFCSGTGNGPGSGAGISGIGGSPSSIILSSPSSVCPLASALCAACPQTTATTTVTSTVTATSISCPSSAVATSRAFTERPFSFSAGRTPSSSTVVLSTPLLSSRLETSSRSISRLSIRPSTQPPLGPTTRSSTPLFRISSTPVVSTLLTLPTSTVAPNLRSSLSSPSAAAITSARASITAGIVRRAIVSVTFGNRTAVFTNTTSFHNSTSTSTLTSTLAALNMTSTSKETTTTDVRSFPRFKNRVRFH
ncbi:uncharacterized protein N7477_000702 [Penicillium maclennaniae]|uniref:uncharacterized protein n=1 Tax=Penicillium maclennaniae TaxID=1343394 RepID=UPI00253F815F|nr:uncharacterized protein N7477_000702 [Penicillium maclennaniae]KAJ5684357.1 hypothetical protein N7477_000702 [Penicillium maclennaniae]